VLRLAFAKSGEGSLSMTGYKGFHLHRPQVPRQLLARGWEHQLATGYWQLYYEQVAMRILPTSAPEHFQY